MTSFATTHFFLNLHRGLLNQSQLKFLAGTYPGTDVMQDAIAKDTAAYKTTLDKLLGENRKNDSVTHAVDRFEKDDVTGCSSRIPGMTKETVSPFHHGTKKSFSGYCETCQIAGKPVTREAFQRRIPGLEEARFNAQEFDKVFSSFEIKPGSEIVNTLNEIEKGAGAYFRRPRMAVLIKNGDGRPRLLVGTLRMEQGKVTVLTAHGAWEKFNPLRT